MMSDKRRVLVVEDEAPIRTGLCDVLVYHGYEPVPVESGEDGVRLAKQERFDLVLLDVMLPGLNGFDACQAIRGERPDQPVIMLTAKGSEDDIIQGFSCGADDYVTKPFSVRELVVRIEALMRRSAPASEESAPETFAFGPWTIDAARSTASRGTETLDLSLREIGILALLSREKGRIVSRRRLLTEVWEAQNAENLITRTVDMHVAKLRKKIDVGTESLIETV
ncbi:MAG: response regulator transcription factor, partial [Myxococcota bacterium]